MLKSNEKIRIESHYTDNVSYDGNKDTDVAIVKEESIEINEKYKTNLAAQIM